PTAWRSRPGGRRVPCIGGGDQRRARGERGGGQSKRRCAATKRAGGQNCGAIIDGHRSRERGGTSCRNGRSEGHGSTVVCRIRAGSNGGGGGGKFGGNPGGEKVGDVDRTEAGCEIVTGCGVRVKSIKAKEAGVCARTGAL